MKDNIEALTNFEQTKELLSMHADLKNYCKSLYTLLKDVDSDVAEEIRVIIRTTLAPFVIES